MSRALQPSDDDSRFDEPIAPLIPPALPPPQPAALDVGVLAPPAAPHSPLLLDVARLGASGRFTSKALLRALGWQPAQPLALQLGDEAVVLTADPDGTLTVGTRGEIAVPAPARTMAGLDHSPTAALVADPDQATLTFHPVSLLTAHYTRRPGDPP
ncbi:hypothetical protein [Actinoplanes subglobosus]|uniref:Uncharacterized protein n=1 Tax=Actinoplanes subglobosus TaxID=1547892 RepID=A0ABV8INU8_9ACTN